ncbi:hypothetical protein ACFGYG_04755 [Pasteurella multocida]|nr:hypothetical protein [Pasteurella multocida]HDR1874060.1 hypothetical protein [Pasteurella multocida]HDR1894420.1 hypothetical protein [Pasteurella multocida]HED4406683.1 hypothetical protein [Pasteurella multocida]
MSEVDQVRERVLRDFRHSLRLSKYSVERHFDKMPQDEKEIIFALAGIEKEHLINSTKNPKYLRDFTESGQIKIARAYKKIRTIANRLPQSINIKEFLKIDKEVSHANCSY